MTTEERLVKLLQSSPDQRTAIDRILAGELAPTPPSPPVVAPVPAEAFIGKVEAARLLGVKPRTLNKWLRTGRIPFYRVGHSVRLRWSEVQGFLEETCRVARRSRPL